MRVRTVVLIAVSVGAAAAAAAAGAIFLPPALAQVPSDPLASDAVITLGPVDAGGEAVFATVWVAAGWTRIGTGPFLPRDRATLVSPDGAYRLQLELDPGSTLKLPDDDLEKLLDAAVWSDETLQSGNDVRYTTVVDGDEAVTVAVIAPPAGTPSTEEGRLVLVAAAPSADAERYRTITAAFVSSSVFNVDEPPEKGSRS